MPGTGAKLEKANLIVVEPPTPGDKPPPLAKVLSSPKVGEGEIKFQFNPTSYTVTKRAEWERRPMKASEKVAMPEYIGPQPRTIDLEIFLDDTDVAAPKVEKKVELLFRCLVPTDRSRKAQKPSPPWVVFGWGSSIHLVAIVTSVNANYMLFRSDGTPTRAQCTISLEEVPTKAPRQNPTSGGLAARAMHRVLAGDTLASIAFAEYDDPTRWRTIAEANDIDDPFRLRIGAELLVPPRSEALS
jgi:Contractile injection system tube protein/LysM domain